MKNFKTLPLISAVSILFGGAARASDVSANATSGNIGQIVFIGDSITQGDGKNAVSYRYPLWKHFVDNSITFNPQGSMTIFQGTGTETSNLITTYLGQTYTNRSEGHFGWDAAWMISGKSEGNRPNTGQNTGGLPDWWKNYNAIPNTATLLMGINDLSRKENNNSKFDVLLKNQKAIVKTLQEKNPDIRIYVFSLLPSAQTNWAHAETKKNPWETVIEFNKQLSKEVKTWSTGTSFVTFADITAGFDPTQGIHTYDMLHPNARGELILAGNIARALGIGQRTAGLERRGAKELANQGVFENNGNTGVKITFFGNSTTDTMQTSEKTWSINATGNIVMNTGNASTSGSDLRLNWGTGNTNLTHEFSLSIELKTNEIDPGTHSNNNFFGIFTGNGKDVGILYIGESGIYWNNIETTSLLYGQTNNTYKDKIFTKDFNKFRIAWTTPKKSGAESGFYVWVNDQLIGEALAGTQDPAVIAAYKNTLLMGDIGSAYVTSAEISAISFDSNKAWAPDSELVFIPEPSAFGFLMGSLTIAFTVSRRNCRNRSRV